MRISPRPVAVALCLLAGAALAHSNVKNAAVKARMHAMAIIGENAKLLESMHTGKIAFDAAAARAAAAGIAQQAAQVPALFRAPETDSASEALPAIWAQFDDFAAKARALQAAAGAASSGISTQADLGAAVGEIGAVCLSCHKTFRK